MTCEEFYEQIQKSEYTEAIKSADLITVSIGSNELLGIVIRAVADVTGVSADDPNFVTNPRITNVNISTSKFNVDPHPNVLGHNIICTKVLDALSSVTVSKKGIENLAISDIIDQTYTGNAIEPEVIIKDGETKLVKDKDYTVSYINNINIGEAKVIITGIGKYSGSVTKTFNIKEKERKDITKLNIKDIANQVYTRIKLTPDIEINDQSYKLVKDKDYQINYSNNINVGTATMTVIGTGNYKGTLNGKFNIIEKDINEVNIKDIQDQKCTGTEIKPEVIITNGSIRLQENKDYTISYNNIINAGKANINITGKGNYKGSIVKQFNIINDNQNTVKNISDTSITEIEDRIYTGKLITPEVRITDGEYTLIKDSDYTIAYSNNIDIGTGVAIITGIGNYSGKVEKTFNITRKDIKYTTILDIEDQKYTGTSITPEIVITSDYITLKQGQDYTVKYVNNINEGTATIQITGIGNYEGTTTKTFNIVREKDEKKNEVNYDNKGSAEDNNKDTTIADIAIPNSGIKLKIISIILVLLSSMLIFLLLYKKNRDI